jgi:hypothetical protein
MWGLAGGLRRGALCDIGPQPNPTRPASVAGINPRLPKPDPDAAIGEAIAGVRRRNPVKKAGHSDPKKSRIPVSALPAIPIQKRHLCVLTLAKSQVSYRSDTGCLLSARQPKWRPDSRSLVRNHAACIMG